VNFEICSRGVIREIHRTDKRYDFVVTVARRKMILRATVDIEM